MLNSDFRDMLSILNEEHVEFLLVGAYAMAAHGMVRATGDIDIWIRRCEENTKRVWKALKRFGAPLRDLTVDDLNKPDIVFQVGVEPRRIDILTSIAGVTFDEAWANRKAIQVDNLHVSVIGRAQLLQNKKATGRPKDLADVIWLESEDG